MSTSKNLLFFYAALVLLVYSFPLHAVDYFVSQDGGVTKSGTKEDPWDSKSIQWHVMGGGDTLYVIGTIRGFASPLTILSQGTSPENRFTIASYPENPGKIWAGWEINNKGWTAGPCGTYAKDPISSIAVGDIILEWTDDPWDSLALTYVPSIPNAQNCTEWEAAGSYTYQSNPRLIYYKPTSGNPSSHTLTKIISTQYGLAVDGKSYIKIDGLVISQAVSIGYSQPAHYVWIDNCRIEGYRHAQGGIIVNRNGSALGSNYGRISNCIISNGGNGIYIINQKYDSTHDAKYWTIDRNNISNMGGTLDSHGIGIQGGRGHLVEFNKIENVGSGITFWAHDSQEMRDHVVRFNSVSNTRYVAKMSSGNGIEYSPNNNMQVNNFFNNDIYGNIVYGCDGAGIRWKSGDADSEIYNNTVYNCSPNYYHLTPSTGHNSVAFRFKNNISVNPGSFSAQLHFKVAPAKNYNVTEGDIDNNLYFPPGGALFAPGTNSCDISCWFSSSSLGTPDKGTAVLEDPRFASEQPVSWQDFKLAADSPAIGVGADLGNEKALIMDPSSQAWPPTPVQQGQAEISLEIGAFAFLSQIKFPLLKLREAKQ